MAGNHESICKGNCEWNPSRIDIISQNRNTGKNYDENMGDESHIPDGMILFPKKLASELMRRCVDDKKRVEIAKYL